MNVKQALILAALAALPLAACGPRRLAGPASGGIEATIFGDRRARFNRWKGTF